MSSFAQGVFAIFGDLQTYHRFVPARAESARVFASMVRSEADDIVVYLFVHDGRPSNSNLRVDLWVAPPDEPDDGLERLSVGYKVQIASEYSVDEQFFLNCQQRVINFLPSVRFLVSAVQLELVDPPFRTKRLPVYHLQRAAMATMFRAVEEGDTAAKQSIEAVRQLSRKGSRDRIIEACIPAAESLIARGRLDKSVLDVCSAGVRSVASMLARQLYIHMLCEQSDSLRRSPEVGQS